MTKAPDLPATSLVDSCYKDMFRGCTGIAMSETPDAVYTEPWTISAETDTDADGKPFSDWNLDMLSGTGGPFTGDPECRVTYYQKGGSQCEHSFTSYTSDNNATCQKNCTETATCDNGCGETDTREIPNSKVDHKYTNYIYQNDATYTSDGTEKADCDFGCGTTDTRTKIGTMLIDSTAPDGDITIGTNSIKQFLNSITFGLFFKDTQTIEITATDNESGVKSIQYYLSTSILSEDDVKNITSWMDYNETFSVNPNNRYVIYVKITDNQGNVTYLGSDGLVLDDVVPQFGGIENGKTYCESVSFTVSDDNLDTVTANENPLTAVNGSYTLTAGSYTIIATDKAGNTASISVTVNASHVYDQTTVQDNTTLVSAGTCTANAVYKKTCVCGAIGTETYEKPGSKDANNHALTTFTYTSNGNGTHTKKHECCNAEVETVNCSGGNASCTTRAICEVCHTEYGEKSAHSYTVHEHDETQHWKKCEHCTATTAKENHYGGTATCTQKAKCSVCDTEYGNLAAHDYNSEWKYDSTGHWKECDCGDKQTAAAHTPDRTAPTETDPVKCTVCGYVITNATGHIHSGVLVSEKPATAETEGTKAHYECACGKLFSDEACAIEISVTDLAIPKLTPAFLSGNNGTDDDTPTQPGEQNPDTGSSQTGDNSNIFLWIALLIVSGGVLTGAVVYSRKRKRG